MIRRLLHTASIQKVNHASSPLRKNPPPCHRNTFFAVCWLMVDPPRWRSPARRSSIACSIASASKPKCSQNRESSAAITADTRLRSILSRLSQSLVMPFPSITMVAVTGTGSHLNATTSNKVTPTNHKMALAKIRARVRAMRSALAKTIAAGKHRCLQGGRCSANVSRETFPHHTKRAPRSLAAPFLLQPKRGLAGV